MSNIFYEPILFEDKISIDETLKKSGVAQLVAGFLYRLRKQ